MVDDLFWCVVDGLMEDAGCKMKIDNRPEMIKRREETSGAAGRTERVEIPGAGAAYMYCTY